MKYVVDRVFRFKPAILFSIGIVLYFTGCSVASMNRVPQTPDGLKLSIANGKVILTWNTPHNTGIIGGNGTPGVIIGYRVYYSKIQGFGIKDSSTELLEVTITSAELTELTAGTAYYFRVSAVNAVGEGQASEESSLTTNSPPGIPGRITFSNYQSDSVTISWDAPLDAGYSDNKSATIIEYKVYYSKQQDFKINDSGVSIKAVPGTSTDITGLSAGTGWYFRISALNAVGEGETSTESHIAADSPPGAPGELNVSQYEQSAPTITWDAPVVTGFSDYQPVSITGYKVYYSQTPSFGISDSGVSTKEVTDTTAVITGLTSGTAYYFKVSALNPAEGQPSVESSFTTNSLPGEPEGLSVSNYEQTALTIGWTASSDTGYYDGQPAALTGYKIYYSQTQNFGLSDPGTQSKDVSSTADAVTGLTAGTTYYFKVSALNPAEGQPSVESSFTTNSLPGKPSSITFSDITAYTLKLSWSEPGDIGFFEGQPASITSYRVYVSIKENFGLQDDDVASAEYQTSLETLLYDLTVGTDYYCKISAITDAGEGPPSDEKGVTTSTLSTAPTGLTFSNYGADSITLSWNKPDNSGTISTGLRTSRPADIKEYIVAYSDKADFFWNFESVRVTGLTADITGLNAGTTYYFEVAALTDAGYGESSTKESAVTSTLPGLISGIKFSGYTLDGLTISWNPPSDTGTIQQQPVAITGYKVYYSQTQGFGLSDPDVKTVEVSTESTAISGLGGGGAWYFRVSASSPVGEGLASHEEASYVNSIPGTPQNFHANTTATQDEILLRWEEPARKGYIDGAKSMSYKVYTSPNPNMDVTTLTPIYSGTDTSFTHSLSAGTVASFAITAGNSLGTSSLTKLDDYSIPSTHTLHFDVNGGTGAFSPSSQSANVLTEVNIATDSSAVSKSGYELACWNTANDGTGTSYPLDGKITPTKDTILYAVWALEGLNYTLINSDSEYSVTASDTLKTADTITVPGYWQGKKVTAVGYKAFQDFDNLVNILLPDGITAIGESAFFSCSSLILTTLPNELVSIGESAFFSCSNLILTTLPNELVSIGRAAFSYCSGLILTTLPPKLEVIDSAAFFSCTSLTELIIPASVTSDSMAKQDIFFKCTNLKKVTIEGNLSTLHSTFQYSALTTLIITQSDPPNLFINPFSYTPLANVYVQANKVEAYKNHNDWTRYNITDKISAIP